MSELKYKELAERLRSEIKSGVYRGGQRLPGELELASKLSCSRQTVRQAIGLLVDEGLVYRMQGSGTYVQSGPPRRTPTKNIAVVTTYIGEHIFPAILHGIEEALTENGYSFMLSATRNRVDNERRILSELLSKPIDGLIVEGTKTALPNPNIDLYNAFAQQGIPVVFIDGYYPDIKSPTYVVADDRRGGRMATELLLKNGHTRIAGFFKSDDIQGHQRYSGFISALRDADCLVSDERVIWYTTESLEYMFRDRDEILARLGDATAVVCYNDEAAFRLVQFLLDSGKRIPEDVAVVSFDNSSLSEVSPVKITSLSYEDRNIGRISAAKLIKLINGKTVESEAVPWTLVEKESG